MEVFKLPTQDVLMIAWSSDMSVSMFVMCFSRQWKKNKWAQYVQIPLGWLIVNIKVGHFLQAPFFAYDHCFKEA